MEDGGDGLPRDESGSSRLGGSLTRRQWNRDFSLDFCEATAETSSGGTTVLTSPRGVRCSEGGIFHREVTVLYRFRQYQVKRDVPLRARASDAESRCAMIRTATYFELSDPRRVFE